MLAEAGYPDGIDVDLHIVTDFQVIVPTMALIVQQDLEAVGIRTTIVEYLSSAYFAEVRTYSKPGMFYFFSNANAEPESVNRGRDQRRGLLHTVSVYPETEIHELYVAQRQAMVPSERAELLEQLYVTFYDNFSWLFLTEISAASITATHINWPIGSAELRGEGTLTSVQKLKIA